MVSSGPPRHRLKGQVVSDDLDARWPVIVTMPEGIDAGNAGVIGCQLDDAFAQGALVVVADCTPTRFCDSVGFNTLLQTNEKAREAKAQLLFVITPNGPLRRVLELLEMQDALAVYPTIEAAVTAGLRLPLTRMASTSAPGRTGRCHLARSGPSQKFKN